MADDRHNDDSRSPDEAASRGLPRNRVNSLLRLHPYPVECLPHSVRVDIANIIDQDSALLSTGFMMFAQHLGFSYDQSKIIKQRAERAGDSPTIALLQQIQTYGYSVADVQHALEQMQVTAVRIIPAALPQIEAEYWRLQQARHHMLGRGRVPIGFGEQGSEPSGCNCLQCTDPRGSMTLSSLTLIPSHGRVSIRGRQGQASVPHVTRQFDPRNCLPQPQSPHPVSQQHRSPGNGHVGSIQGSNGGLRARGRQVHPECDTCRLASSTDETSVKTLMSSERFLCGDCSHPSSNSANCHGNSETRSNDTGAETRVDGEAGVRPAMNDLNISGRQQHDNEAHLGNISRNYSSDQTDQHGVPYDDFDPTCAECQQERLSRQMSSVGDSTNVSNHERVEGHGSPGLGSRRSGEMTSQPETPVPRLSGSSSESVLYERSAHASRSRSNSSPGGSTSGSGVQARAPSGPSSGERRIVVMVTHSDHSREHTREVARLCRELKNAPPGVKVKLAICSQIGTDREQLSEQRRNNLDYLDRVYREADHIVVCVSPTYLNETRAPENTGDEAVPSESSLNARLIFDKIRADYYQQGAQSFRVIPVLFPVSGSVSFTQLPQCLSSTTCCSFPNKLDTIKQIVLDC